LDGSTALKRLREDELVVEGRLIDASNATFYCRLVGTGGAGGESRPELTCVYKPIRGERPLDDFPHGTLARRELAAYRLSEATGWAIVPPTVLRDGPFGLGMVQQWIEADPTVDVVELVLAPDPRLRRIALYDVLANNADRKGSHLLPLTNGHIHGVDHGVCFAVAPKLRTVLWAWRGQVLEPAEVETVQRVVVALDGSLSDELAEVLSPSEVRATRERAERLLEAGRLPQPDPSRPAIPWPPF
jgi:hypothetical protein